MRTVTEPGPAPVRMRGGGRPGTVDGMSTSEVVAVVALLLAACSIRIVREYRRVVVFRHGRLRGERGPRLALILPFVERTRWVSLQIDTSDVPPQDLITKDNVTIRVEAAPHASVASERGLGRRVRLGRRRPCSRTSIGIGRTSVELRSLATSAASAA